MHLDFFALKTIINKIITKSQHCSHDTGSRGEQHNVISIGQSPKKHMTSIAANARVMECTQKTVSINAKQDGTNYSTLLDTIANNKRTRANAVP